MLVFANSMQAGNNWTVCQKVPNLNIRFVTFVQFKQNSFQINDHWNLTNALPH